MVFEWTTLAGLAYFAINIVIVLFVASSARVRKFGERRSTALAKSASNWSLFIVFYLDSATNLAVQ